MVGVPGRSKGCITCRKRKVKCDEEKPYCNRCRKAYMICEGYAHTKGKIFVNHTGQFEQFSSTHSSEKPLTLTINTPKQRSESPKSTDIGHIYKMEPLKIWTSPDLRGFQLNICITYMTTHLFPWQVKSWIFDALEQDPTSTVYYSALCLSTAFFGRLHHDEKCLQDGAEFYGNALTQMSKKVQDSRLYCHASTIAAAILLVVYELSVCENRVGWIQHAGGIEKLIHVRGPEAYRQEPARSYFRMSRIAIIGRALSLRRKTFLEDEEWLQISFSDPLQRVLDIVAAIPALVEESDRMKTSSTNSQELPTVLERETLRIRVTDILRKLVHWRWEWELKYPNMVYEVPVQPRTGLTVDDTGEPLYPAIFCYRDFHQGCRAIMFYDSSLLLLMELMGIWKMKGIFEQVIATALSDRNAQAPTNPLLPPNRVPSPTEVCREISRSVEYHLRGPEFGAGAMALLLPLSIIANHAQSRKEKEWLQGIMHKISHQFGFRGLCRVEENMANSPYGKGWMPTLKEQEPALATL